MPTRCYGSPPSPSGDQCSASPANNDLTAHGPPSQASLEPVAWPPPPVQLTVPSARSRRARRSARALPSSPGTALLPATCDSRPPPRDARPALASET
ncbi:uncharacterized protein SCHCODRAFT_02027207 [Schizophyllum commune H4-8]|uniref:uncharacterized protein n=1 Tax=Schizophyllum commune (strain H4-8 / FGSC 9210) TaxID=578458 RepID=UPI00215FE897|nr:uncharacterized protein SCHCODRAFT_02027207 [Schizophyllum commune H4-8]KAI5900058.1 hypothetical protein SCHCODRAFT_02027207 [Schizophyllum commune H4-8]